MIKSKYIVFFRTPPKLINYDFPDNFIEGIARNDPGSRYWWWWTGTIGKFVIISNFDFSQRPVIGKNGYPVG